MGVAETVTMGCADANARRGSAAPHRLGRLALRARAAKPSRRSVVARGTPLSKAIAELAGIRFVSTGHRDAASQS